MRFGTSASRPGILEIGTAVAIAVPLLLPMSGCGASGGRAPTAAAGATTGRVSRANALASQGNAANRGGVRTKVGGGPRASSVRIVETDAAIEPSEVVVRDGPVTFNVTNRGRIAHSLEIQGHGIDLQLDQPLQPGEGGAMTVEFKRPGLYRMFSPVPEGGNPAMGGEVRVAGRAVAGGSGAGPRYRSA
jgi:uncharacterized cupredoxin-like copper-binding protein